MPTVSSDFELIAFGKLDDDRIPCPRTCGARFCSNGIHYILLKAVNDLMFPPF